MRLARVARLLGATLLGGVLLGCASEAPAPAPEPSAEIPVSDIVPGLRVRGSAMFSRDDHLVEILVHAGHVYAANSWGGLGVLRLEADGGLTVVDPGTVVEGEEHGPIRCTSLALHPSSDTLYCASDAPTEREDPPVPAIERVDVSSPGEPVFLEPFPIERWSVRDIVVVGDTLLIHQFTDGLWTASIGPDGALAELQQLELEGNFRSSAVVGDRVVTLLSEPEGEGTQLRLYDPSSWTELARLSLFGPPIGISADVDGNARVAVALGSGGMAIVDVTPDSLTLARTLAPPAVVNFAALSDGIAAAFTYSGAFTWDLHDPALRMFGFGAEGTQGQERNGAMLHGLIHEGELLSSDWTWIERWAIDPSGEVVALDVPRGFHIGPTGPIAFQLRNPGALPLRAELWVQRRHVLNIEVPGEAVVPVEISELLRGSLLKDEPTVQLAVRVYDPEVPSYGQPVSSSSIVIVQREQDDPLPPAVGDTFPQVSFGDRELALFSLPRAETTQLIWLTIDCALMWPEIEDVAWLARSGIDTGRGVPVIVSNTDLQADGFATHWSLDEVEIGVWGPTAPADVQAADAVYGDDVYSSFAVYDIPADGVTMDYVIGPDEVVRSLERMYRGPWSLALAWPWE